tara:strand:+ start:28809 stop:29465 length:657 start_codon:yes stop_codon:yes gene_type:complete
MLDYEKYNKWLRSNKWTSSLLVILSVLGIASQTTGYFKDFFLEEDLRTYDIININLDNYKVSGNVLEEGFAMGNNMFEIPIDYMVLNDFTAKIESNPNNIYFIRIKGETPINSLWIGGASEKNKFSLKLGTTFYDSKILHFPDTNELSGWNTFHDSPNTSSSNFVVFQGFFHLAHFREKQDVSNQYKVSTVEPDQDIAKNTLRILKEMDEDGVVYFMN